jgi:hypothetical protein
MLICNSENWLKRALILSCANQQMDSIKPDSSSTRDGITGGVVLPSLSREHFFLVLRGFLWVSFA